MYGACWILGSNVTFLEKAGKETPRPIRAGEWLLGRAERAPGGGLRWARGPDTDGVHEGAFYPTFCCGTAGVAYYLLALADQLRHEARAPELQARLVSAAVAGGAHLLSLANVSTSSSGEQSLLLPHEEEGEGRNVFYLGWAHAAHAMPMHAVC